ncbi:ankyrin [Pilatotrama ljubarskyi]|nr:ankyrin [Pilatotrama ljubarskyi]
MPQTVEAQAFLARIAEVPPGPGATESLIQALQPSLDDEATLRKLFATESSNARLQDPHVGMVDVFDAPVDIRTTRPRVVANEDDLSAHYILPLSNKQRRKEGEPAIVSSLDEFKRNWAIFSEGSLSQLVDWSNVVAAGGSVQACLMPLPDSAKKSKRAMRKYFHSEAFPTSDVDLFLYGLTPEQGEVKMQTIYEAVRDSVPWDVTCVRTKHTVSIHSQYPYRSVQIVLRLYASPAEILAGFDVDAPCCLYDGERVWANPRAIVAMMRQCNTVDMTRRSPSYEVRLMKYASRGFEVHVPTLRREDIDPTIFERSILRVQGLARLLVLERLRDADTRTRYLADRRKLRTRPDAEINWSRRKKRIKGDLKANMDMNDYDVQSLHVPYGPGWDARRIDKLVYQTDLGMNSPFNPKNKDRRLHRHPAFFGTMAECLDDCCEYCPEPKNEEEKKLQETEDESYVRGRVQFIREDPGRQSMSGSFHPIDDGEWAEQAYMGPTEKLFNAIVSEDRTALAKILGEEGIDVDRRDHVGRTPLLVAILSKAVDVACDLIDAGARMTSRLVDGRTALHLAAQLDLPVVVRKLLDRSAVNAEKAKEEEVAARQAKVSGAMEVDDHNDSADDSGKQDDDDGEERDSSEDDWASHDDEGKPTKHKAEQEQKPDASQIPEDEKDLPDVFDVNLPDWDYAFTPLQYAVVSGSLRAIDELLAAGADPKLVTKADGYTAQPLHPLTLTVLTRDIDIACEVAKKLFANGAASSEADDNLFTIFHKVVCAQKPLLVDVFLRHDPNAKAVLNSPYMSYNALATFPIVSAVAKADFPTMAVLLAYGAKIAFTEEDWSRARELRQNAWAPTNAQWRFMVDIPVEVSLAQLNEAIDLLVNVGAEYNVGIRRSYDEDCGPEWRKTILDYVRSVIPVLQNLVDALATRADDELSRTQYRDLAASPGWKGVRGSQLLKLAELGYRYEHLTKQYSDQRERLLYALEYFRRAEETLVSHGAKTGKEVFPDGEVDQVDQNPSSFFRPPCSTVHYFQFSTAYYRMSGERAYTQIPPHFFALYDQLFEACSTGDKAKIKAICLPKDAKSKPDGKLLQITCRFGNDWGMTPLSLALTKRHWGAARLILAIAVAQYKPKAEKPAKFVLTRNLALEDDDSESGSRCESDEEMDSDDGEEVNFIDIAHRRSQVETDVPPARLLTLDDSFECPKDKTRVAGPPLFKAVMDDDFEALVQILDLYKSLPEPVDIPTSAASWVTTYDRPTMLDELIRRTGCGVDPPEAHGQEQESTDSKPELPPKTYLGLNVHGKKRRDLVQKADPNAPGTPQRFEFPLLWTAARAGAVGVVQYLATERPLAAYDYYVSTHSDDRAQYLRRIRDQIPQRLGWTSNDLNESVVTAAVIGDHVDVLEAVVALQPVSMRSALMSRIHYVGFNHILVAANWGCSPGMFDYLLSKGVSPTDTDVRGVRWNIYHLLCAHNSDKHLRLLKHIMEKLPEDVSARSLLQQSKGALNTPLHIAIKRRSLPAVRLLLQVKAPVFGLRDQSGSTPLHVAVRGALAETVQLVGEAGPSEVLHLEDGVGNTPLEIATQAWLQQATPSGISTNIPPSKSFTEDLHYYYYIPRTIVAKDVKLLKETVDMLLASGRLRNGTKLATELVAFANKLEAEVQKRAEAEAKEDQSAELNSDVKAAQDQRDQTKTLAYITGAVAAHPSRRGLVHLFEVHRSVKGSLERSAQHPKPPCEKSEEEDGLEAEAAEDRDEKAKRHSAIAQRHSNMVMPLFGADPF